MNEEQISERLSSALVCRLCTPKNIAPVAKIACNENGSCIILYDMNGLARVWTVFSSLLSQDFTSTEQTWNSRNLKGHLPIRTVCFLKIEAPVSHTVRRNLDCCVLQGESDDCLNRLAKKDNVIAK